MGLVSTTAPPIYQIRGPLLLILRWIADISEAVLLETKIGSMFLARRKLSPLSASSNEYVIGAKKLPSRSLNTITPEFL